MTRRRTTSSVTVLAAALVAAGAAVTAAAPAQARPDAPAWASWARDGAARTAAVRAGATQADGGERAAAGYRFSRVSGSSRYATSVAASRALYTAEVLAAYPLDVVFVASGTNYPDALAATSLVPQYGPLLLVPSTGTVPAAVLSELRRLDPEQVAVVGGTGAVSAGVEAQVRTVTQTSRVQGSDRYGTAATAARLTDDTYENEDLEAPAGVRTLFVVNGTNFPDALAAGAATGVQRGAIVLTRPDSLPTATAQAITDVAPGRVVVLGGATSVNESVVTRIRSLVPGKEVVRRAGSDRFGTAAQVSRGEFADPSQGVMLANGLDFPDALSAAGFGAVVEYPLLLSRAACAPSATVDEAAARTALLTDQLEVVGVGGTTVLSANALQLVRC